MHARGLIIEVVDRIAAERVSLAGVEIVLAVFS
jgi:hypothetical protein